MTFEEAQSYFSFKETVTCLEELDTPIPVIDLEIVLQNLISVQRYFDNLGIAFRPHVKTHKMVPFAKIQLHLGACGITVQKLGEAEIMAEAGIGDILIAYNIIGQRKLTRLINLARQTKLTLVADNEFCITQLNTAAASNNINLDLLIECDTGFKRNGLANPEQVLQLAQTIVSSSNLRFKGLMTYPPSGARKEVSALLSNLRMVLEGNGIPVQTISSGGTRDLFLEEGLEGITEYRAGTYIFNDRIILEKGSCQLRNCAARVLTTVVSKPTEDRIILDAGSKALTSDLNGLIGYGIDPGSQAKVRKLSEEHGQMEVIGEPSPNVGDLVEILPNHICPVINLYDYIALKSGDKILGFVKVDARGRVS